MGQTVLTKEMINHGVPIYSATIDNEPLGYIPFDKNTINLEHGDLVIPARGNSIGYVTYIKDKRASCTQTTIYEKFYYKEISLWVNYYYQAFKNVLFQHYGAAIPQITVSKLLTHYIPIPPKTEQKRIVEYIEDIFAKIDVIEKNQSEYNILVETLKKAVLQFAIQGKLVEQDSTDEPASVLLERIRAEKKKQLGKKYVESYIFKVDDNCYYEHIGEQDINISDNIPFDLPENWCWSRIKDISDSYIGLTYKPTDVIENGGSIVLRSSNIKDGHLDLEDIVNVKCPISDKLKVKKNDIIICARNGSKRLVGKSALVDIDRGDLTFGAFMAICKTPLYSYVAKYLLSELFFSQLRVVSGTTTINQLTQNNFNTFLVPTPPLAEQQRIVEKINEIFAKL